MRLTLCWLVLITATGACADGLAQDYRTRHGTVRVVTVAQGLNHPWGLAWLPDGRMLVTERPGRIRIVSPDGSFTAPLTGVPEVWASGQGGLLDIALAPDFATSRFVYISYSEPGDRGRAGTAVARARLGAGGLEGLQVILRQEPKASGGRHFGSRLVFTPDGYLFVTLGERGQSEEAQDLSTLLGKVVRIRPDGSIPGDNPFTSRAGARPEIWSYGHRNPQGAVLHPSTGELWTISHAAMGGDEVNISRAGRNYGWPVITYGRDYSGARIGEGTSKPGMEQPLHYWDPSIAPSGAVFYTGDRYSGWNGSLFTGSLKFGLVSRLEVSGNRITGEERILEGLRQRIRDIRQGPDGYLYLLTDESNGRILRLEPVTR